MMPREPEISRHEGWRTYTYSREFKAEMVSACLRPGASVAAYALSHGMYANVVHRWLKDVLTRLPTHKANRIEEQLPHFWQPIANT